MAQPTAVGGAFGVRPIAGCVHSTVESFGQSRWDWRVISGIGAYVTPVS